MQRIREAIAGAEVGGRLEIVATKRDAARITVRVAGVYVCAVGGEVVRGLGVRTGDAWSAELAEAVVAAVDADRARASALRRLERRALSRAEVARGLAVRGHSAAVIERTIATLERAGAIDDPALAASVGRSLVARGGAGARLIEVKLRRRGIGADAARAAAESALAGRDVRCDAESIARSRARGMIGRVDRRAAMRCLVGLLGRRGYDGEVCWEVARAVVEEGWGGDDAP